MLVANKVDLAEGALLLRAAGGCFRHYTPPSHEARLVVVLECTLAARCCAANRPSGVACVHPPPPLRNNAPPSSCLADLEMLPACASMRRPSELLSPPRCFERACSPTASCFSPAVLLFRELFMVLRVCVCVCVRGKEGEGRVGRESEAKFVTWLFVIIQLPPPPRACVRGVERVCVEERRAGGVQCPP